MEWSNSLLGHFKIQTVLKINCCTRNIARFFHFSLEIGFNPLRFINYTIPRLCLTYAVATLAKRHAVCARVHHCSKKTRSRGCNSRHMNKEVPTLDKFFHPFWRKIWEKDVPVLEKSSQRYARGHCFSLTRELLG